MSATTTSADGSYIFNAIDDNSGFPLILRAERPDNAGDALTWVEAYAPNDGSAVNVIQVLANADQMLFYGNFGTDVCLILHTISADTNDDISPASLGLEVINCLANNPSSSDEIIVTIDTGQKLLYTSDGGVNWSILNDADPFGFTPTALVVIWGGGGEPHRIFVGGSDGADVVLLFSPNDGVILANMAGATLVGVANIAGIEAGYVA